MQPAGLKILVVGECGPSHAAQTDGARLTTPAAAGCTRLPVPAGPSRSHKSAIASFLAGMTDSLSYNCGPTVGVRVLETERSGVGPVEVWDVSGDQSYENTWPAVQKDTDGVLLLFNADTQGHAVRAATGGRRLFTHPSRSASLTPSHPQTGIPHPTPLAEGGGAVVRVVRAADGPARQLRRGGGRDVHLWRRLRAPARRGLPGGGGAAGQPGGPPARL